MRALKDKGMEDLHAIRTRAQKLSAMGRIDANSYRRIMADINKLEATIIEAYELDPDGDEIG
jgi:hypothetical protein